MSRGATIFLVVLFLSGAAIYLLMVMTTSLSYNVSIDVASVHIQVGHEAAASEINKAPVKLHPRHEQLLKAPIHKGEANSGGGNGDDAADNNNDVILGIERDADLDKATIRRIVRTTDPLYHGQIFSKHFMLPTAHHDLHSVKLDALQLLGQELLPEYAHDSQKSSAATKNVARLFRDSFNEQNLHSGFVIPAMVMPTFKDGDVLRTLLENFDTPVRHWTFINNAAPEDDENVRALMAELAPLTRIGAVTILPFLGFNRGYAAATNLGLRRSREVLFGLTEFEFIKPFPSELRYIFSVNCDAIFRPGSARLFAREVVARMREDRLGGIRPKPGSSRRPAGLFYSTVLDQYAWAIKLDVISTVGYLNEAFFPAYMEDIDFKWRVYAAGFERHSTPAVIDHHQSINLKRESGDENNNKGQKKRKGPSFNELILRSGHGFELGWMIWGRYEQQDTVYEHPPSKRMAPFGIDKFPLHLWRVDPGHRRCIITGQGVYHIASTTCWYNGTMLLSDLPPGTKLPRFLREPAVSMRDYREVEPDADLWWMFKWLVIAAVVALCICACVVVVVFR